jgi:hypothetical protein
MKRTQLLSLLLCLSPLAAVEAALIVNPTDNGTTLTNSILGSGITLVGTPTYSPATSGAGGTFSGGASAGIGIDSGLILTTGLASSAPGPNDNTATSGAGVTTSLMFSFTTSGGSLFFNYFFASEEYNEFVGTQFNDLFELRVDGVNIAFVPSTTTPVKVNNVNNSVNSAYYNDNTTGAAANIEYDGFTDVFQAQALNLAAGTHTIEFLIADAGDSQLDSAVFIQGNSFSDTPTAPGVPDGGSTLMLLSGAVAGLGMLRRKFAV